MIKNIFVNIQVKDLNRSIEFFKKLGFSFNPQFSDETAASMVIYDNIFYMLITPKKYKTFIKDKQPVNPSTTAPLINALSAENKQEVDDIFNKAIAAGAKEFRASEDHGFMYLRSFEDLDGYIWEILWMDPETVQK